LCEDFLQRNDATRTALERRKEVRDVDLNFDDYVDFIELALLLFKGMILSEYYKRVGEACPHDLSNGGVGVTGVGFELLDELFTMPTALSPELEKAIEEFAAQKRARANRLHSLEEKAAGGGVRAMSAKNELAQLNAADVTEMNRLEITLNAAKRRAGKQSGEAALREKKNQQAAAEKTSREASRQRLADRAAMFG
jgi:F actin bundling C terminal